MKEYIDKLKEIETLVELSIGTTMTEEKAADIYAITNELMCKFKKLNIPVDGRIYTEDNIRTAMEYGINLGEITTGYTDKQFMTLLDICE